LGYKNKSLAQFLGEPVNHYDKGGDYEYEEVFHSIRTSLKRKRKTKNKKD
jgi:hypothetical protein